MYDGMTNIYLDAQVLVLSTVDQIAAHIFQRTYVSGGQSDTDAMNGGRISALGLLNILRSSSLKYYTKVRLGAIFLTRVY